jgi:CheY-like chemotaxis protein
MSVLSRLMRGMCKQELKASMWTQKSIVFIVPDKNILEIKKGLELIRKKYLEEMKDITKLQLTPGLRVVLDKMSPELPLVGAVDRMINQLIIMSRNENLESIAFYAEYQSLKKHIIIADPDPVSVNVIRHRLSREGYIVEKADSAEKLLTHPALNDIAALLVDSAVSGGGIGMVKELRREAAIKDIPIMLLSRYGHEEEISEAFEAGVRDYLLKPFSPVELSARIKRLTA